MTCSVEEFQRTVVARWHATVRGGGAGIDPSSGIASTSISAGMQSTRVRYYEAFLSCLAAEEFREALRWNGRPATCLRDMVVAAAGSHSSSTLYSLFGPMAKTSLLMWCGGWPMNAKGRRDILAKLAAEVKVCSHWPYRSGWLAALRESGLGDMRFCAETLVLVLAEWAANNVPLARTYGNEPPLSVVEDLALITRRQSAPAPVWAVLTRTIMLALSPAGSPPSAVLDSVRDDLAELDVRHRPALDGLEERVACSLAELQYMLPMLADAQRSWLRDEFATQLADVVALLGDANDA